MITYDVFQPMSVSPYPDMPFTATILKPDGEFKKVTISGPSDLVRYGEAVAIKFDKPEPFVVRAAAIAKGIGNDSPFVRKILREALAFMEGEKVDRQPSMDWLEEKMDHLGLYRHRGAVRNWFFNSEKFPTAPLSGNFILTVKPVTGGRVIVAPSGHTIAYTKAQQIWWAMNDTGYFPERGTTVGEYTGVGIKHTSCHRILVKRSGVSIGCQHIPRSAIEDLAKREGWSTLNEYGG